jgi:hypothetical protein
MFSNKNYVRISSATIYVTYSVYAIYPYLVFLTISGEERINYETPHYFII